MKLFENRTVVLTGSRHGIGQAIAAAFERQGAIVYDIDLQPGAFAQGDLSDPTVIEAFAARVIEEAGSVDIIVNNAPPLFLGIDSCSYDQFMASLAIGAGAPFYLVQLLRPYLKQGSSIINISSTRDSMSQAQSESYAAAKGAIAALTHALAMSLGPNVRVNAISPGWIDVQDTAKSQADHLQQPAGRVGMPEDIAALTLFLCSEGAGFITGQNIVCDGGMSPRMIYDGEEGWSFNPHG